ncbi:hypothetical protein [Mycobacteroides immunogenum]|uniref:PASTA domain-containing protein n=1 Tax=Mycobacteroides immunogenum TaxID=83262 RepID=A0A0N1CJI0_9MYCO|nr:hypothetical protein [Mycobacteroides immunogenum]AMT69085.1 hypothetical protein ABG82_00580 [Mycobacteroides immunogenum]ANO02107.1 hypothetical protein BAB75_00580 [Mycobacteroides immunogenum]KIU40730.1 hypothetical protein TL11_10890 [Mycobacteroides immunogenum]KPG11404.1 hypothetical protein AN908_13685 [Mycobacteroides immunogenum]KPG12381.1 hypothetical protein AN909_05970 [Mycobacteroides immunogenum]
MKKYLIAGTAAAALALAPFGFAVGAAAAQSDGSNAQQTISELQSQGYSVIVSKTGSKALTQCTASSVRPGQTTVRSDYGLPSNKRPGVFTTTTTTRTMYVDVTC